MVADLYDNLDDTRRNFSHKVNYDEVLFVRVQSVLTKLPRIGHNRAAPIMDSLWDMRYQGSPTSIFPLFARWRSSLPQGQQSEEHTSELQSQSNLVCRLLLEK